MTILVPMPPALAALVEGAAWDRNEEGEAGAIVHRLTLPDGSARYLKYGEGRVADDVADEAIRLRWLQGRLPAPALRLFICEAGSAWLLSDAVPGLTGDEWIQREPTRLPPIVRSLAGYMRRLHALPVDDCPFDAGHAVRLAAARRNVAEGRVPEDDFDAERRGWSAAEVLAEAEHSAPKRFERVVTHGDLSLGNVLFDEAGAVTGCIDVGRLGVADPYQDIGVLWGNLAEFGDDATALLLRELGIAHPDKERLLFHQLLDELF